MSVLIVEDDEGVRQSLADILRQEGYHVDAASDGAQALGRLQRDPLPSLIVFAALASASETPGSLDAASAISTNTAAFSPSEDIREADLALFLLVDLGLCSGVESTTCTAPYFLLSACRRAGALCITASTVCAVVYSLSIS